MTIPKSKVAAALNKGAKRSPLKTEQVLEILDNHKCCPFSIMAKIAINKLGGDTVLYEKMKVTPRLRLEAAAELAKYIAPQLKSIELENEQQSPVHLEFYLDGKPKILPKKKPEECEDNEEA